MAKDDIYCLDGEDSELPPQRDDGNITDDVADDTHDVLDALQSELGGRGRGVQAPASPVENVGTRKRTQTVRSGVARKTARLNVFEKSVQEVED